MLINNELFEILTILNTPCWFCLVLHTRNFCSEQIMEQSDVDQSASSPEQKISADGDCILTASVFSCQLIESLIVVVCTRVIDRDI